MIYWITPEDTADTFPPVDTALPEPDGLLAAGGDLTPARLIAAYRRGIFPWFSEGEPILWWCPSERAVIKPEEIHISRSLNKVFRRQTFRITKNTAFNDVIAGCAAPRHYSNGTWITEDMMYAYRRLHQLGYAHSIECWLDNQLAGGLYGVKIGNVFFGESMFSAATNASKVALVSLARQGDIKLIDCQIPNDHLETMGMTLIPRQEFIHLLNCYCEV